jgi:hypothetical protein
MFNWSSLLSLAPAALGAASGTPAPVDTMATTPIVPPQPTIDARPLDPVMSSEMFVPEPTSPATYASDGTPVPLPQTKPEPPEQGFFEKLRNAWETMPDKEKALIGGSIAGGVANAAGKSRHVDEKPLHFPDFSGSLKVSRPGTIGNSGSAFSPHARRVRAPRVGR